MRLGFHYHVPAIAREGHVWMPGFLGCFVDSLASHCSAVICFLHSPRPAEATMMDYCVAAGNVELVNIGPHSSVMDRTLRARTFTAPVRQRSRSLDAMLIRGPSPLLPAMAEASRAPIALMLVSDYVKGVDDLPQPRWRKEAIRIWAHWNSWRQHRAAQHALTFVNSRLLYNELAGKVPDLLEIRTTTLSDRDLYVRGDTCQSRPLHLLFTGRITVQKGLFEIVDAMARLVQDGDDVVLDVVGWPEPGKEDILDELRTHAEACGLRQRVLFHGYKSVGPELFSYYRNADVFVLASRSSFEGFPRTIWEAMAHCLPVVTTKVGSIPAFIEGAAEFVEPGDVTGLAGAIRSVIHDPSRRRTLVERGFEIARGNTLETQTRAMVVEMEQWLGRLHA